MPNQTIFAYENTQADEITDDLDFHSFKVSVRSCARSKILMKRPLQTKMRYDPKCSFKLWKDSGRPKKNHDPDFEAFVFKEKTSL